MILKRVSLVLLSAAALFVAGTEAALKGSSRQEEDGVPNRRDLGSHAMRYRHHVAIQEAFAAQQGHYAEDDDTHHSGGYLHVHDSSTYYDYHVHEANYLSPDITPRPFTNCIPESYHENNRNHGKHKHKHGKNHHDHKHKHHPHKHHHQKVAKHHLHTGSKSKSKARNHADDDGGYHGDDDGYQHDDHNYDGHDEHEHEHDDDATAAAAGTGDYLTAHATYSKGRGHGGHDEDTRYSKAKGSKGSKSSYYRQRNLGHHRQGRGNHHQGRARRGYRGSIRKRQGDGDGVKTMFGTVKMTTTSEDLLLIQAEDFDEDLSEPQLPKTKKYNHFQHHHHGEEEEEHLPICPNTTPVRRTFGPVPTIPPRGAPTIAPGNATAPTVSPPGAGPAPGPDGTTRVFIMPSSSLSFGLFEETTPRAATQEEIDALLARTSEWYVMKLQPIFPTLVNFETVFLDQVFDTSAEYPIKIDFDAVADFEPGTEPTVDEIFMAMQNQDYQIYITEAVWTEDQSGGIFESTQRSTFNARVVGTGGR